MVDSLSLLGNEPVWIFRRRGGAAREVGLNHCLLAGVDFLGTMEVDLGVEIFKISKKKTREREREREESAAKSCGGENEKSFRYL